MMTPDDHPYYDEEYELQYDGPSYRPIGQNKTHKFYRTKSNITVAFKKGPKIPMKITKKFYVGSRSMIDGSRSDWAKKTLQEAIEHAKELCEETDEEQIVVQIVRVVRPQKRPTIVETIR